MDGKPSKLVVETDRLPGKPVSKGGKEGKGWGLKGKSNRGKGKHEGGKTQKGGEPEVSLQDQL